jgi:hypothetical protein
MMVTLLASSRKVYVTVKGLLLQNKYHYVNCMMYEKVDETDNLGGGEFYTNIETLLNILPAKLTI